MTGHVHIGAIIFPGMDQIDFTGPFEILVRVPDSTFHVIAKDTSPMRDIRGLILTPEESFDTAPPLDVLVIPGGYGQEALMDDDTVLAFIRRQAAGARYVFSVCTGALVCGAAGLLKGKQATTHWRSFHLLSYFGAIPAKQRVVVDGKLITAAGVTAGIDGALQLAALLRGNRAAKEIQLYVEYAPEPPFRSGTPETAPPEVVSSVKNASRELMQTRLITAKRIAMRLGIDTTNCCPASDNDQ
jgi:cyclohexyl-isocyanide hydratase